MRIIKGKMTLSIGFHNASRTEDFSFEVDDTATDGYINGVLQEWYEDFVWEKVNGDWEIESDEKIEEE